MLDLSRLPKPSQRRVAIHVKPAAERSIRAGHPWLYEDSITRRSHEGKCGDQAVVYDRKNRFLAIGLYDPYSSIRVRVLAHNQPQPITIEWFKERLIKSIKARSSFDIRVTNGYRLVHGENDEFPGLVLDRYGRNLVLKLYSSIWAPYLADLLPLLVELTDAECIVLRLGRKVQGQEGALFGLQDGLQLYGPSLQGPVQFYENNVRFEADIVNGHKTGFYLDQRENRAYFEEIVKSDSSFNSLLNVFAYSGGFSIYGARAGASQITNVDISKAALKAARNNFRLNMKHPNIMRAENQYVIGDAFEVMDRLFQAGRKFDAIVIDPPSFASRKSQVTTALRAYGNLARSGIKLLREGGLLALFSCSSRVSEDQFFKRVVSEAVKMGRPLQEINRTGHPSDHPSSFEQGAYLKGVFALIP
ncbi:MAG: 23S rRNA (cytosine(2499)-C(5))-methyltransferase [Anaerolineae bacterium]|nr:MAG: 23S rRNA (cytosine(2499)-C(5))-methyltransferase [Anaerolineae bacterium]